MKLPLHLALPGLVADLKEVMQERADYVEKVTGGDPAKIPIGPLPAPENVKAVPGTFPGTIKVSCKAINWAKFYPVEARPHHDPTAPWV